MYINIVLIFHIVDDEITMDAPTSQTNTDDNETLSEYNKDGNTYNFYKTKAFL